MNNYQYYLGWDVSKGWLNYCWLDGAGRHIEEGQITNDKTAIERFIDQKLEQYEVAAAAVFMLVEHTGLYSQLLLRLAYDKGLAVCLEDALRLAKSHQRRLDKSDHADARIIATYGFEKSYKLALWQPSSETLLQIKVLHRRRRNLLKSVQSIQHSLAHSLDLDEIYMGLAVEEAIRTQLSNLKQLISTIDEQITQLILADEQLSQLYAIVRSCFAFGPKNTIVLMLETGFFKKVSSAKACANYAGLRPLEYSSGSSVRYRKRSTKKINTALKTAFHSAAFSAATKSKVYRAYYQRKIAQGKTHLQALGAIRNKLCRTVYACVENQVMYDENFQSNLVKS